MNKLQVPALFGSGCGGAGPAESRRCIAVTLGPCLQLPPSLPQPPWLWPGCSDAHARKHLVHILQMEREKPQTRGGDQALFSVEAQAGGSPWVGLFLPCYASYKYEPIPKHPPSTHGNKSAGLSLLVLIRVLRWERCWLSQMRTSASRLAGVSTFVAVVPRCESAPSRETSALDLHPCRQQHPWLAMAKVECAGHAQVWSSLAF